MPNSPFEKYEEIEHTADWALKVRGRSFAELLENAAHGMMELAGVRVGERVGVNRSIELEAPDKESLLVDWLQELLLLIELDHMAFGEMELVVTGGVKLHADVHSVPVISIEKPIKAVTYNELHVESSHDGFEATIVFDV